MYIIFITSYITQTGNIPDTTWLPPMVLSSPQNPYPGHAQIASKEPQRRATLD